MATKEKTKTEYSSATQSDDSGKELRERAIDIKGKKYVLVSDRVIYFNEHFKNGSIKTEILAQNDEYVLIEAVVTPDSENPNRFFTGHARELFGEGMINRQSAVENAETSAIGRALAMMGIGVIDSIASADELNNATRTSEGQSKEAGSDETFQKKARIQMLLRDLGFEVTRENAARTVRMLTELDLKESNYDKIIERLTMLRGESA